MPDTKVSALTALDSTADLGQLYIPLFKADGSPDNARILASTMFLCPDVVNITPAWSGTGTAATPLLVNVTADPGPANAASKLLDLQVGGVSRLAAFKTPGVFVFGHQVWGTGVSGSNVTLGRPNGSGGIDSSTEVLEWQANNNVLAVRGNLSIGTSFAARDVILERTAADRLALRRGANAQRFEVYRTYTDATTWERGVMSWYDSASDNGSATTPGTFRIGTEKGSVGGTAQDVALITGGTVRVTYGASGGETKAEGHNVALGTTTGTKIGTATGQKLGFWNATPVVQQVLATGGGATVDNVITLLQTLGLCKQS